MIDKNTYLNLKREIKHLCRKNVIALCDDMGLNEKERELLLCFYDDKTIVQTCMELGISSMYYNRHLKLIFSKINDYKNTLN